MSQRTEKRKVGNNTVNVPIVEFEYEVNRQRYLSDVVTPFECMLPNTWKDEVLQKYPVGAQVQAYYDPADPSQAFLLPKYGGEPYVGVLVCLVIAAMGVGAVAEQLNNSNRPTGTEADVRGMTLLAKRHHLSGARVYTVMGLVGLIAGLPTIAHHLSVSTSPHERLAFLLEACFAIAVLVVLMRGVIAYWRGGAFGSPVVRIDRPSIALGEPFQLNVDLPTSFRGKVNTLTAQITCEAKDTAWFSFSQEKPDTLLHRQRFVLARDVDVLPVEALTRSKQFILPEGLPPSTSVDVPAKMQIVWTIKLSAVATGWRKIETTYVVAVTAPLHLGLS